MTVQLCSRSPTLTVLLVSPSIPKLLFAQNVTWLFEQPHQCSYSHCCLFFTPSQLSYPSFMTFFGAEIWEGNERRSFHDACAAVNDHKLRLSEQGECSWKIELRRRARQRVGHKVGATSDLNGE